MNILQNLADSINSHGIFFSLGVGIGSYFFSYFNTRRSIKNSNSNPVFTWKLDHDRQGNLSLTNSGPDKATFVRVVVSLNGNIRHKQTNVRTELKDESSNFKFKLNRKNQTVSFIVDKISSFYDLVDDIRHDENRMAQEEKRKQAVQKSLEETESAKRMKFSPLSRPLNQQFSPAIMGINQDPQYLSDLVGREGILDITVTVYSKQKKSAAEKTTTIEV